MTIAISFTLLACLLYASSAHAYIDPGSGSAIISGIIGLFVAVTMAIKGYWYKLKGLLTGKRGTDRDSEQETDPESQEAVPAHREDS